MAPSDAHRAVEAVWRIESARLIAGLARMVRDVLSAEPAAQPGRPMRAGPYGNRPAGRSDGCRAEKR